MGIFDFFKKKPKFVDDFFGELSYRSLKETSKSYYAGQVQFQGNLIGIILTADEKGPTDEQKIFFKKLDSEYIIIKENIILPFLKKELQDNLEESGLENFDSQFDSDAISIGEIKNENTEWSITYDAKSIRHFVTIDFEGMQPKYMSIDG